jgi:hypothetical protein
VPREGGGQHGRPQPDGCADSTLLSRATEACVQAQDAAARADKVVQDVMQSRLMIERQRLKVVAARFNRRTTA